MAEETLRDRAVTAVYTKVGALFQGELGREFSAEIADAVLAVLGDVVPAQPLRDLADEWEKRPDGRSLEPSGASAYYSCADELRALLPGAPTTSRVDPAPGVPWVSLTIIRHTPSGRELSPTTETPVSGAPGVADADEEEREDARHAAASVSALWPQDYAEEKAVDEQVAAGRVRVFNSADEFYDSLDEPLELQADAKSSQDLAQPTPGSGEAIPVDEAVAIAGRWAGKWRGVLDRLDDEPAPPPFPGPVPVGTPLLTPWGKATAGEPYIKPQWPGLQWVSSPIGEMPSPYAAAGYAVVAEWAEAHRARTKGGQ